MSIPVAAFAAKHDAFRLLWILIAAISSPVFAQTLPYRSADQTLGVAHDHVIHMLASVGRRAFEEFHADRLAAPAGVFEPTQG